MNFVRKASLIVSCVAFAAGCSASAEAEHVGASTSALTSAQGSANISSNPGGTTPPVSETCPYADPFCGLPAGPEQAPQGTTPDPGASNPGEGTPGVGGGGSIGGGDTVPVANAIDLANCIAACEGGAPEIAAFCASIPVPQVQALCFANQFAGVAMCSGFCYAWFIAP